MKKTLFAVSLSFLVIMSQAGCGSGGGSAPSAGGASVGGSDSGFVAGPPAADGSATTGGTATTGGSTAVGTTTGGTTTGGTTTGGTTAGATTATGVAKLSWNPPAEGAAGFKLYYGTSSGSYSQTINVGAVPSFSVSGLPAGTYYFVVTAYDALGHESLYSNEVAKTIS